MYPDIFHGAVLRLPLWKVELMNSLFVAGASLVALALGYRLYGKLMCRLWDVDPVRPTPAHAKSDGVDFVPAKHWTILFGHHFASIAGAGPVLGPVAACIAWGWAGGVLWIVVGTIFFGAVHDFSALMVSIKQNGKTIANACEDTLGRKGGLILAVFLFLALVLVIAVFAAIGGKTMAAEPRMVIPAIGIIPVAVLTGFFMRRFRAGQLPATLAGVSALTFLIIWGRNMPVDISPFCPNPALAWTVFLLAYAFAASILPVDLLLQPRDYLSTFLLFFGIVAGYAGLVISRPVMQAPAFISFSGQAGPMWPIMFVTIACGAISGFHSIVSSGTTSRQLDTEANALRIGFGAMVLEAVLAILALLAVAAGLNWIPQPGLPSYPELMRHGWMVAFNEGFGRITAPLLGGYGALIAATILNAFIITTLDTATRVTRYLAEETTGVRSKYLWTFAITLAALFLSLGGYERIWPVFGASNQLVAALTLLVVSAYLLARRKRTVYTMTPAVIMLVTSDAALILQLRGCLKDGNILLAVIAGMLLALALYMASLTFLHYLRMRKQSWKRGMP